MGSSVSKAAKAAGKVGTVNTVRKYPKTASTTNHPNVLSTHPSAAAAPGPSVYPEAETSSSRNQAIDFDSSDPDFQSRLRDIGPVTPNPTFSNSSTYQAAPDPHSRTSPSINAQTNTTSASHFQPSASTPSQSVFPSAKQNPAVSLLTARYRLAEEAEREFEGVGRKGSEGRRFLDVVTIRQVLALRDEKGMSSEEIERVMGLRRGVVGRLGVKGVVGVTY